MLQARKIYDLSTNSNSPRTSTHEEQDYMDNHEFMMANKHLEIDVKPKKKKFTNFDEKKKFIQDYKKKIKTELCKTFMLKGSCRYGNKCSFAHGPQELKEKCHLNSNFKTRPCKQYFLNGMCPYGYRCQYLHRELKYVEEYRDFLINSYAQNGLSVKEFQNFETEKQKLTQMEEKFKNFLNFSQDVSLFLEKFSQEKKGGKRLEIFRKLEDERRKN